MLISSLINSFLLTMIIEFIIIKMFFLKKKIFISVLLMNLLTNPLVVYLYYLMLIFNFKYIFPVTIFMEIMVCIVEGIGYKYLLNISFKKALAISTIANATAYLIGLIL